MPWYRASIHVGQPMRGRRVVSQGVAPVVAISPKGCDKDGYMRFRDPLPMTLVYEQWAQVGSVLPEWCGGLVLHRTWKSLITDDPQSGWTDWSVRRSGDGYDVVHRTWRWDDEREDEIWVDTVCAHYGSAHTAARDMLSRTLAKRHEI